VTKVPFYDVGQLVRSYSTEIHACLDEVIDSGYFVGGPITGRFEAEFAASVGTDHCVGTGNGLDALRLILEAYGIGPGDEVIVPAFTFFASWLGVTQVGATPVPVDVQAWTGNIEPDLIRPALSDRTKAILPVHLNGRPADMAKIRAIADELDLLVVEDAAQAHGARTAGGNVGSLGHAAAFSFYPTKNLGALGDAGCVTTSDEAIAERIRSRRSYGQGDNKYEHTDTGWNSRLDPFQASVLSLHLSRLDEWTKKRRAIVAHYASALGDGSGMLGAGDPESSVWHHVVLRATDRPRLQSYFSQAGIATDVHYPYWIGTVAPMERYLRTPVHERDFPGAVALASEVTSLPIGPWMTDDQVDVVVAALELLPKNLVVAAL
jgi:dTDP-3-amino-3,4,6-trideoxy-alpha-D-glucose transaminase